MVRITRSGWRISLATLTLAAAAAIGASLAWADAPASAPAPAPANPNHAAAVDAFKKAYDLYQKNQFPEANAENEKALKLEPDFSDAILLRRIIQGKLAEGAGTATPPGETPATTTGPAEKARFLSPADIAILKVDEFNSTTDAQIHGTVARKTLDDFWNNVVKKQGPASDQDYNKFVNINNFAGQVKQIRDNGDPKYMEKITFNTDPAALLNYKKNIQPYVLQNCATAACHAGDKAGNFKLYRPANAATDSTLYTNFYILSTYANKDGKMIDRNNPDKSLLLQYGMIKAKASIPHPGKIEVRYFTDSNDPRFQPMVDWIKSLAFPTPQYGIIYELPGSAPPPAPATAPTPKTPATRPAK